MKKSDSDDVRIVLVSSDMHRWPKYDLSQMNYSGDTAKYSMFTCYGNSKLYQVYLNLWFMGLINLFKPNGLAFPYQ